MASFFFYSLGALGFTGNLVSYLLSRFGLISLISLSFIAISDGTLGGMSYILANSRTFKAMSADNIFPTLFAKEYKGKPIVAEAFISVIFVVVLTAMTHFIGLYNTFVTLGSIAGLANVFIHSSANFSLLRISSRRALKHIPEMIVAVIALLVSIVVFIYSLPSIEKYIQDIFFGWIIFGFLYAEALDIMREDQIEKGK